LRLRLSHVLSSLSLDDARHVYAAIRLAQPGGLGKSDEQDISVEPTVTLLDAMRLAADHDLVARQYANDFAEVFEVVLPALRSAISDGQSTETAIIHSYLTVLSRIPDTLIVRKVGREMAEKVSRRAAGVLSNSESIDNFDRWLRADGHRRNPGSTADLITAALFVALSDGTIELPAALANEIQ
jgi:triphosphoribosyl-dephospho-CoA synthase